MDLPHRNTLNINYDVLSFSKEYLECTYWKRGQFGASKLISKTPRHLELPMKCTMTKKSNEWTDNDR